MLQVTNLGLSSFNKPLPSVLIGGIGEVTGSATLFTISNVSIATPSETRRVVIALYTRAPSDGSSAVTPTAVILEAGTASVCKLLTSVNLPRGGRDYDISLWITDGVIPNNSTANIVVTTPANQDIVNVKLISVYDLLSSVPFATASNKTSPHTSSVYVPNNGIVIAHGTTISTGTLTLSGINEIYNTAGIAIGATAYQGTRTSSVTMTPSGVEDLNTLLLASLA